MKCPEPSSDAGFQSFCIEVCVSGYKMQYWVLINTINYLTKATEQLTLTLMMRFLLFLRIDFSFSYASFHTREEARIPLKE